MRSAKTVIVGGGIAGLAAAWALLARGEKDFVVLDLESTAGGNSKGHQIAGLACPLGAHYLPVPHDLPTLGDSQTGIHALMEQLGLMKYAYGRWQVTNQGERYLCHSPQERLFFNGTWQDGLLPVAGVPAQSLEAYQSFSLLIEKFSKSSAFTLPSARSPFHADQQALDELSFAQWLQRVGIFDGHLLWYLDYCCRDDYGAGLSQVSAWAGVHYFASRHGFQAPQSSNQETEQGPGVFTWPQGNGWISEKLVGAIGDRFQGERLVSSVTETRDKVRISSELRGSTELWECEQVVIATPLFLAQRLVTSLDPYLTSSLQYFTQGLQYASWMVANAYLKQPLKDRGGAAPAWDNVIYGGAGLGYVNAKHQSLSQVQGPTILTYYQALGLGKDARAQLLRASTHDHIEAIRKDLLIAHPDFAEQLVQMDIARYGHAMAVPIPGARKLTRLAARDKLLEGSSRLRFAHSDLANYSVFEEAFSLGAHAGRPRNTS